MCSMYIQVQQIHNADAPAQNSVVLVQYFLPFHPPPSLILETQLSLYFWYSRLSHIKCNKSMRQMRS